MKSRRAGFVLSTVQSIIVIASVVVDSVLLHLAVLVLVLVLVVVVVVEVLITGGSL